MFVVLITSITNAQIFDFGCSEKQTRLNQLAALVGQHNVTSMTHFESDPGSTPAYVGASYVQNGSPSTFGLSTSVGLIEDITDWSTKYSELVAKLIADSGIEPTTHAHRAGVLTSYNSIDGISNIEVKVDNPTNLSVATVSIEWDLNGIAQDTYYFSATNPTVDSNGQVPGDLSYYEPGQFETNRERLYNKLIAHIPVGPTFESELEAIYDAATPPTELGTIINDAALAVEFDIAGNTPRKNFMESLAYFNVTVSGVFDSNSKPSEAHLSNGNVVPNIGTNANTSSMNPAQFAVFAFEVVKRFWHIGHPNYDPFGDELTAIYGADTPPTGFTSGGAIETEALAFQNPLASVIETFMKKLNSENYEVFSLGAVIPANVSLKTSQQIFSPYDDITVGNHTGAQIRDWALDVVQALWHLEYPEYAIATALRATRITDLNGLSNTYVTVQVSQVPTGAIVQEKGNTDPAGIFEFFVDGYGSGNEYIEDLSTGEYANFKADVTAKRNELTPTVAKELAAWFTDTANVPTGAAPDYLPTALYAKANTLSNGTERFNFIRNELLSAHGVTITNGGAGQTGATVTTFILSKGDGYNVTFDWGAYSTNGFNGNDKASPELYRNLVFDIIKAGWKLVNETHNTKRSDWLDQDLDITGNDVELITYGPDNYDWWIYFNVDGLQIPILSGGIASDPMFYNKYTVNPHDTYMTEVEFQTLVVFVTYMRDNFDRLKGITGDGSRRSEIIDLAGDLNATYSASTNDNQSHWLFTNKSTGKTHDYRVQSNWTREYGTSLGDLTPDQWVKFYAKCRGIILGLQ